MLRAKLLGVACLLWLPMVAARAQAPSPVSTVTGPAGTYTIVVPHPAKFEYGVGYLMIQWGSVPPGPIPPIPPSPPEPPAPPAPTPAPVVSHAGPFYVSLVLPANPTQGQNDLRVGLLALDGKALKIEGRRSYLDGQPELTDLKLDDVVQKHTLPVLLVQEKPAGAKEDDTWPIIAVVEPRSVADIQSTIEGLAK